jgi:uncharacterized membrane protein YfcA
MWTLIIGIVFIFGGLSGGMVLRGTESGLALAGLGLVLCLWGGYQLMSARSAKAAAEKRAALRRRPAAPTAQPPQGGRTKPSSRRPGVA